MRIRSRRQNVAALVMAANTAADGLPAASASTLSGIDGAPDTLGNHWDIRRLPSISISSTGRCWVGKVLISVAIGADDRPS